MSATSLEAVVITPPPFLRVSVDYIEANDERKSTNRNWMEHIETVNGPGAYDVLRIDLTHDPKSESQAFSSQIWGLQYHLNRLEMSFRELLKIKQESDSSDIKKRRGILDEHILDKAVIESKAVIDGLVSRAKKTFSQIKEIHLRPKSNEPTLIILVKVTLFWTISDLQNAPKIIVRGHASTDGKIINPLQKPDFIRASLAMPPPLQESDDGETRFKLPDRLNRPHAKISSWLLQRKSLEKKETFQPEGVNEILLLGSLASDANKLNVNRNLGDFEILEGTSSNFFVIYKNNTIRTAQKGVLFGYVRHLVLLHCPKCGLKLDLRPCRLEDGLNGLWKETFITSSSRLIIPIQEILMPDYGSSNTKGKYEEKKSTVLDVNSQKTRPQWKKFWKYEKGHTTAKWELLLREIKTHKEC